mgnify:CR=1 FL=1|jgi:nucleoside-diphosphate-sugar epimerase
MKRNVLVVGCMGHIGFSLAKYIASQKISVVGFYNKTTNKSQIYTLKKLNVKLFKNNLSDPKKIINIIKKYKITDCIYASAIAHDSIAQFRPHDTLLVNSLYPNYFIKLVNKKIIKKFIYISTGSVFQNIKSNKTKIDENFTPSPKSLYAISKRAAEIQIENSFFQTGQKICILRVSWVYGPPLLTDGIVPQRGPIPYALNEIITKKKKTIHLPGKDFEASFTYIEDVCENLCKLVKMKNFKFPIFHLGTGQNQKISELIYILKKQFRKIKIKTTNGFSPWSNDSVIRGPLISKKLKKIIKCRFTLSKGLREFIKFYA